jgi:uracil-DNA glycosylase family 4
MAQMDKPGELSKIAEEIRKCRICKKWGRGKAVPGEGCPDAGIVFVGEAPGREEAVTGRPFVGRSGRLLRTMIREIGLDEDDVFITSPVKYLPVPGTPSLENIRHGKGHLAKQLSVIDPQIIVLLGNTACLALFGRKLRLTREHGTVIIKDDKTYLITFHPAYVLRFPSQKEGFFEDFGKLRKLLTVRAAPS